MTHDMHHLAAAYALDAVSDQERSDFEAHFLDCDICTQDVADFRDVAARLASTAHTEVPGGLKADVMAQVRETRQLSPLTTQPAADSPLRYGGRLLLAAAAAVLLFVGGFLFSTQLQGTDDRVDEVVSASDLVITTLGATGDEAEGNLQVLWSDELDRALVVGSEMAPIRDDQAYALWFVVADGVAPAGLFRPSSDGAVSAVLDLADLSHAGWGITIEPLTGSPQPTSDVIYLGTF